MLLGPTGAGKTTTLRLVAGLDGPTRGASLIGGRDVTAEPPAARNVTFVFQQYSLYPHLSVFDNLAFPLRSPARRVPEPQIDATVREIARMLRIDDKLANKATQLSGGEMQRVAIGRALVRRPSIYLMDEPLSSLDAKLRADLRLELKRIQEQLGATMLYVTHDQIEAMTMATASASSSAAGWCRSARRARSTRTRSNAYVATRLGQPRHQPAAALARSGHRRPAGRARASGRAPSMSASRRRRTANGHARAIGTVTWVEHLGDQDHLHIALGDQDFVTLSDPDSGLQRGDPVVDRVRAPAVLRRGPGARIAAKLTDVERWTASPRKRLIEADGRRPSSRMPTS